MSLVLVVDDDESDRLLLKSILQGGEHDTYLAANGEEALNLYLRYPIEVVVTDMQVPRGDGLELIAALKRLDPGVPIVAVSGKSPHRLDAARLAGAATILTKPVTAEALLSAVTQAITAEG